MKRITQKQIAACIANQGRINREILNSDIQGWQGKFELNRTPEFLKGWECTDRDSLQFREKNWLNPSRKNCEAEYCFKQWNNVTNESVPPILEDLTEEQFNDSKNWIQATIDVKEYSGELHDYLSPYGYSYGKVIADNGFAKGMALIAECIFETDIFDFI